ncbi:MAG: hypothetical protein FRX48_06795 [Lasallia pustulata]|uniref:Uncharacterized protein n=1 Tax=Lasallia pustulata TaxID=136370 RepID=A0A5M8PK39_9LECA|nr:MAG: hypothetical protein FRX48_06795 [Lasallia pustulata]
MAPVPPGQRAYTFQEDPIELIWGAVVPILRNAWNTIMSMYPISPPSPVPPPKPRHFTAPGITASRRAACSHLTMTRLYGDHKCDNCKCTSAFGFLYRCCQDYGGELPMTTDSLEELFDIQTDEEAKAKEREKVEPAKLKPWMEKAIEDGHYTEEHIRIMKAQKQKVRDTIGAAEKAFEEYQQTPPFSTPISSEPEQGNTSTSSDESATSSSIDASLHLPFPVITEVQNTPSTLKVKGSSPAMSAQLEPFPPLLSIPGVQVTLRMVPKCSFMCCQRCRPTFQDRCFLHIEDILHRTGPAPNIDFATDNRPITDAAVVRKLGLDKPKAKRIRTRVDKDVCEDKEEHGPGYGSPLKRMQYSLERYSKEDNDSEQASKGFRESVRRAFRGMITNRRRRPSKSSQTSRRLKCESEIQEEDGADFDMGMWKELNDELLEEASDVQLPGHDGMDGLDHEVGEVEVLDGVSVTEEGVDLGAADIIMSV